MSHPREQVIAHIASLATGEPTDPSWRVTLHFHPDRLVSGTPILDLMARDGVYRSQFETGSGNGGLTAYRDDVRWWNVRPPDAYMDRVEAGELPIGGSESLDPSDAYLEEVFLKLRILEGVPASWFEPERYEAFVQSGLLDDDLGQLVPTERGMLLLNELVLGLTS